MARKKVKQKTNLQLAIIHEHTAAIDVGSMMMMVAYSDLEGNQCVVEIDAFTEDLQELVNILKGEEIKQVAMEATGVYWMALYELLEKEGIKVVIVNPKHFKNVDGQKTDVNDCQWLHQLHVHGLLRASHIAPEIFRELRSYIHERNVLQNQKRDVLNRIHKQLTQMNIKVQHLISDIEGVSGMRLLRGIAAGINNPEELLKLLDLKKLKATKEELLKSLNGLYKDQYIFILRSSLKSYDFFKAQMKDYELLIENILKEMLSKEQDGKEALINSKTAYTRKNQYSINVKGYLKNIIGIDLTKIDGLEDKSVLEIISVTGLDMNKWPTAEHFTSWLNLSPRPKITGGKLIGYGKRFTNNNATQAFRLAAQTMWQNKGSLGQLYRRLSAQKGSKKAIKAVARKLAVIFYNMIKYKTEFDKSRLKIDVEKQKARKIAYLQKEAKRYGLTLHKVAA